ncbi:hypothetical protein JKP88DRAFT_221438 [Tribonema minus]|uniref:Uncharacterized protein n=1 Tax=Tribonema minus TaxID=303371 RepID=A0A835YVB3_9STRA|nr:hypothetical protein JKP88DRAFT_221438 [Tribonema minus]
MRVLSIHINSDLFLLIFVASCPATTVPQRIPRNWPKPKERGWQHSAPGSHSHCAHSDHCAVMAPLSRSVRNQSSAPARRVSIAKLQLSPACCGAAPPSSNAARALFLPRLEPASAARGARAARAGARPSRPLHQPCPQCSAPPDAAAAPAASDAASWLARKAASAPAMIASILAPGA